MSSITPGTRVAVRNSAWKLDTTGTVIEMRGQGGAVVRLDSGHVHYIAVYRLTRKRYTP